MADRNGEKPAHHTYSARELKDLQESQMDREVGAGVVTQRAREETIRRQRAAEESARKAAEDAAKSSDNS